MRSKQKVSSDIPERDIKILFSRGANHCAMCRTELIIDAKPGTKESVIGQMAHIKGENEGSARYDSNMTDKERNSYSNLILLCPNHHKTIDDQRDYYTVERLHEIKNQHEELMRKRTADAIVNVTFIEIEEITRYLMSDQINIEQSLTIIPQKEKIIKNALSNDTERQIIIGMVQIDYVRKFIKSHPDIMFGERLKQSFVAEYNRLKKLENLTGDELFEGLFSFASGNRTSFTERAAALAVLTYLFDICEVFEK